MKCDQAVIGRPFSVRGWPSTPMILLPAVLTYPVATNEDKSFDSAGPGMTAGAERLGESPIAQGLPFMATVLGPKSCMAYAAA